MIDHLKLRNFKSIKEVDINLRPLNVLIGRNGSGKSTFLNFFRLLRDGAMGNLNSAINTMGGFSQVMHYAASQRDTIEWELTFEGVEDVDKVFYKGEVARRGTAGYSIHLEELERPPYQDHTTRYKYLSVTDGRVRYLKPLRGEQEDPYDESEQELVIAQIRNRARYPILSEIRRQIADWQIFRGFGSDALQNIRAPQVFNVIEPLRLDPSGNNLVSVLQQVANDSRHEAINDRLEIVLSSVFPEFVKLDIPISAGGMGTLNYRSQHLPTSVPALSMSDGQLRFLGLVLLLVLPDPPPLIAIDEPEVGLHPEMLPILAELLTQAAAHTQLIVTTHSPQLIDALTPDQIIVVEQLDGNTVLERLDADRLERWIERYTLGKLWTMGKLETR